MNKIDWSDLSFDVIETDYNIRAYFRDGVWSKLEASTSAHLDVHIAATGLHYGQQAFEGLKAFRGIDGKIRIFRLEENAKRLQSSCRGIMMAEMPVDLFCEAIIQLVKLNKKFIPPYGIGASFYIRPLLFGASPRIRVTYSSDFTFVVFGSPVGSYSPLGFVPTPVAIEREFDRAAPHGTGNIKVGGNYAAGMVPGAQAHDKGYSSVLYLDAKERKYLDECGAANFFCIKDGKYITPLSDTILPSITNNSLMTLAQDLGLEVERRPILVSELAGVEEAGQVGTAAVISPISRIDDLQMGTSYQFSTDREVGKYTAQLYQQLLAIQQGEVEDKYNWTTIVD